MSTHASPFLDLLEQIASGITIFQPFFRRGDELAQFQTTVERLLEMERLGLVKYVWTQKKEIEGREQFERGGGAWTDR